ncbi:hypothetical protein LTR64_000743 [Lithohypha guttulata]|uniref:uncharacterized protein n=1 Tax=Lithohypha guttulata TaxID=1690604 RepID=UPI002DE07050|nr:hypothetical protein LTR51_005488 [Lithohypha guttulata]
MLAYELDLPIGLNIPLTVLSAFLAVFFTFVALASDLAWDRFSRYRKRSRGRRSRGRRMKEYLDAVEAGRPELPHRGSSEPLVVQSRRTSSDLPSNNLGTPRSSSPTRLRLQMQEGSPAPILSHRPSLSQRASSSSHKHFDGLDPAPTFLGTAINPPLLGDDVGEEDKDYDDDAYGTETSSDYTYLRRYSDTTLSTEASSFGLGLLNSTKTWKPGPARAANPILMMLTGLWHGITLKNIAKGFFWSLAITSMHYAGILALKVPEGWCTLHPALVLLSAIISWVVCTVGCILMSQMESYLIQQIMFAVVATTGVAAMHFTGMSAARFWTNAEPQEKRGYPTVHSATIARNKLTDIIRTRRKLWAALAQKEHAEAAAQARSEFIASASHEIRTPLHQLQGYGDLLSREHLTEEGRVLLRAIQDATKTLSLITNNVLDWSRLEKGEAAHRPTFLQIRDVIDSVIGLLPIRHEESEVEILVAVAPEVPSSIFMDELSLTRIILNLLSNACKFTTHGYVLLTVTNKNDDLIISVEDTGCGVPASFLPQLFEPYKQAQTRGAERGTGLGLSIVKQLLAKMRGTIHVDSKYREDPGVGPEKQGSIFTVTIPLMETSSGIDDHPRKDDGTQIAIFEEDNVRLVEGLTKAWAAFGVEVKTVGLQELSRQIKYIWASAPTLAHKPELLRHLSSQSKWLTFVPYDNENSLYQVLGSRLAPHIMPIKRPLVWHRIMKSIEDIGDMPFKAEVGKPSVRFAEDVEIMNGEPTSSFDVLSPTSSNATISEKAVAVTEDAKKSFTIMLVEDNKINQKLGVKMVQKCGYDVIVANDGQEAIDLLIEHDSDIDLILMDQSMPRKDGLQATKEIREMEEQGKLEGSRKFRGTTKGRRRVIIAVTAVVGPSHEQKCIAAGTDAFLPKPLSLGKLRETLTYWFDITDGQRNGI